jgi:hypothetical protein
MGTARDIVGRLRDAAAQGMDIAGIHCDLEREAADEIERLRNLLADTDLSWCVDAV